MDFYERNIKFYKQFKVVDTDGDGIKDTMVYSPSSSNYYIQIGLNQDVKDIGYYTNDLDDGFEVIDLDDLPDTNPIGDTGPLGVFDPSSLVPNDNQSTTEPPATPQPATLKSTKIDYDVDCLAIYTDWGPWNKDILLDDKSQIYVTKTECTLTFRFVNQLSTEIYNNNNPIPGGWYGASIRIDLDEGEGFKPLKISSSYITDVDTDITFNSNTTNGYTLGDKVRIWKAYDDDNNYYSTKPFRDLTIKPPKDSKIRITYLNPSNNSDYTNYAKHLRLQVIKGDTINTKPKNPTEGLVLPTKWGQNTPQINTYLGTITDRVAEGETFHYLTNGTTNVDTLKNTIWDTYLNGYKVTTKSLPWGETNKNISVSNYYNNGVNVELDFGDTPEKTILSGSNNESLNYYQNPSEILSEINFKCLTNNNLISYYDKNGDGFIEYDQDYPKIDPLKSGSVDTGLFSKTRYDSPYIYLKPNTIDGVNPLEDNELLTTTNNGNNVPTTFASPAGWRDYAYVGVGGNPTIGGISYSFAKVSPTCQLGGVDNFANTDKNLVDVDNYNLFLPQSDYNLSNSPNQANFGTGTTLTHSWNQGGSDARGGCCAKQYSSTLVFSTQGPYLDNECSTCHMQMTTRSAQPVLNDSLKIAMQTTDSDVYYGPFYDPKNPTYNGYGLAFSKANTFCRKVKGRNGVQIINSEAGTNGDSLYIGGILHGGAIQTNPNTDLNTNYGVIYDGKTFNVVTPNQQKQSCPTNTKLPLKCSKVVNDPNCPKGNCIKCVYCFKCNNETIKEGVFIGKENSIINGPTNGVTIITNS